MILTSSNRRKRCHCAELGMDERIEVLKIGQPRSGHDAGRKLAGSEESWEWLQPGGKGASGIDARLHWKLRSPRAQVAQFKAGIVGQLTLHAQSPGQDLRLHLVKDDALGCRSRFLLSGGGNIHLSKTATREEVAA